MADAQNEIDDSLDMSSYSGTFRWKASKNLPSLPPISRLSSLLEPFQLNLDRGWRGYFYSRGQFSSFSGVMSDSEEEAGEQLVNYALKNLCLVDCLSFPLSISYALSRCGAFDGSKTLSKYSTINILCTGCAQRAEERILRQTNAFEELLFLLPGFQRINLWLIGPEMSETNSNFRDFTYNGRKIVSAFFQGNIGQFFRENTSYLISNSVVFGFNCGFGNFENPLPRKFDLLLAWIQDLFFLSGTQLPLFFTCANHYADVSGEVSVMYHLLGAMFTLLPQENPFSFASTLIPPEEEWRAKGQQQPTEFSRGNAYFYGVQHCDRARRKRLNLSVADRKQLLGSLLGYITQKMEVEDLVKVLTSAALRFEVAPAQTLSAPPVPVPKATPSTAVAAMAVSSGVQSEATKSDKELKKKNKKSSVAKSDEIKSAVAETESKEADQEDVKKKEFKKENSEAEVKNIVDKQSIVQPIATTVTDLAPSTSTNSALPTESKLLASLQATKQQQSPPKFVDSPTSSLSSALISSSVPTAMDNKKEDVVQPISSAPSVVATENDDAAMNGQSSQTSSLPSLLDLVASSSLLSTTACNDDVVRIEQSVLLSTRQLQILISSHPPHCLAVNTLALNLHTSGQRLRISSTPATVLTTERDAAKKSNDTPSDDLGSKAKKDDQKPHQYYYSREIVLYQAVACSASALEAKYSRKKNLLTVKIALAGDEFLPALNEQVLQVPTAQTVATSTNPDTVLPSVAGK